MNEVVKRFFRSSERVVLVVYYVFYVTIGAESTRLNYAKLEQINFDNRFDKARDWRLFAGPEFSSSSTLRNWYAVSKFMPEILL